MTSLVYFGDTGYITASLVFPLQSNQIVLSTSLCFTMTTIVSIAVIFAFLLAGLPSVFPLPTAGGSHRQKPTLSTDPSKTTEAVESESAGGRAPKKVEQKKKETQRQDPLASHSSRQCKVHTNDILIRPTANCKILVRSGMCSGRCESFVKSDPKHGLLTASSCSCCQPTNTISLPLVLNCVKLNRKGYGSYRLFNYQTDMALPRGLYIMQVEVPTSCACKRVDCGYTSKRLIGV
eukprot:m.307555 g.307555  ORF g.307555 m.307555 type:complete len:235 (+) comp42447_c0_seq1:79-783(+)